MSAGLLLAKCRDAKRGGERAWSAMSTGEKVSVALVLNRFDWLAMMGYTMAEAIDRAGAEWRDVMVQIERQISYGREGEEDPPVGAQVSHRAWIAAGIEDIGLAAEKQAHE